jgi:hypothetical protein
MQRAINSEWCELSSNGGGARAATRLYVRRHKYTAWLLATARQMPSERKVMNWANVISLHDIDSRFKGERHPLVDPAKSLRRHLPSQQATPRLLAPHDCKAQAHALGPVIRNGRPSRFCNLKR